MRSQEADKMTTAKARLYKTAIVASNTLLFKKGTVVSVEFVKKEKGTYFFKCTDANGKWNVLGNHWLESFVL